jgi:hypothetical protein
MGHVDEATTLAVTTLDQPPWLIRLWNWLRFGGWRWSMAQPPAAGQRADELVMGTGSPVEERSISFDHSQGSFESQSCSHHSQHLG